MPRRPKVVERGHVRGVELTALLQRELRDARHDRGLSQASVATALGVDRSWVSRVERGRVDDVGIIAATELLAAVGLELSVRAYPSGGPLRDAAHSALLEHLRARIHRSLSWATEVPLPMVGDMRAWDALIRGRDWRCGVEAETRPRDLQALERRLALKLRDGGVDMLVLLLLDSRHNRALVRENADALHERFPVPGLRAIELLGAGVSPGGSSLILL
ncbi:MAG TPA: helix-turn-helix transcriptional regulator [Candidatus Limnocylindrales bacterium]